MKELKEELTRQMHAEFNVNADTETKLTAGTVWEVVGFDCTEDVLKKWCNIYDITIHNALKWKDYWLRLHKKTESQKVK